MSERGAKLGVWGLFWYAVSYLPHLILYGSLVRMPRSEIEWDLLPMMGGIAMSIGWVIFLGGTWLTMKLSNFWTQLQKERTTQTPPS